MGLHAAQPPDDRRVWPTWPSSASWATTDGGTSGPLGASSAVDDRAWGEFPAWPTSAADSWLLIQAAGGDALFSR
jgi:hypothetical protein